MKIRYLVFLVALSTTGCAELQSISAEDWNKLAQSLQTYNRARSQTNYSVSSNYSTKTPEKASSYSERPCQNLTDETVAYSNNLRRIYPNYNSDNAQACRMSTDFLSHLKTQKSRAASCDKSGSYRAGLDTRISQYQNLLSSSKC